MTQTPALTISHVVLHCFDHEKMADFYKRVLGLRETDRKRLQGTGPWLVFLSSDPRDHHQIALTEGRTAPQDSVLLHQVSFRHDSLDRLRRLRDALQREGITDIRPVDHGTHWSMYFHDPEGNMIEAFVDTPWYMEPKYESLDLSMSDEEIMRLTEERFSGEPDFRPLARWRAEFAEACGLEPAEG